ncbi:hypothetical protein L1787_03070 [Acuticoccus sp. M5D2P5]|uniref:hypothetical protein n=1 Tax=Acuticoccus kalidii TaxID=2910977 RepID=UPI001F3E738D|nr:hypothetical protein [Acuticoccus kalidii]MCF3932396.1 hypothetical protein [Acuticoccus kalidii]
MTSRTGPIRAICLAVLLALPAPRALAEAMLEAYPVTDAPVSAIRIITARPLAGETCRDALFDGRPLVRERREATFEETIEIRLDRLCLLELRNDADDRTLEIRVGEPLATVAITADQRLFRGMALSPGQTTTVPIRALTVGALVVPVDVLWADDAISPVERFVLRLTD